jgi:hypothetical protein
MSMFRPTTRTTTDRAPFRSVLAAIVVAGLATIGVTAFAAPAAAEESVAVAADSAAPAAEDPAPEVSDPAVAEPGDAAVDPSVAEATVPPAEEAAAPPAEEAAAPPADESAAATDQGAAARASEEPTAAAFAVVLLVPPGEDVVDKVEICHATSSYKNPYIINEPNANGDVSGHADHIGPIFYPEIPKHTEWGDIIPPFYYGDPEDPSFFPGLNWDEEGQAIYENDCVIPTPTPELVIEPIGCVLYTGTGWLDFTIGPLQENVDYLVEVWNSDGEFVVDQSFTGETGTVGGSLPVPPGDYTVTLSQSIIEGEWEVIGEQDFTIAPCPDLGVTVTPGVCSTGDDGTATVLFTGLIEGEAYGFVITGPGSYEVADAFTADGPTEELMLGDLPPGSFVAYIQWNGGGEESPLISASVDFSVSACPPVVPTTPAAPIKPAVLAATGTDGVGGMLAGSMLLLGLGSAVLLAAARRRQTGVRDLS